MSITKELREWAAQPIRDYERLEGIAANVAEVEKRAEELERMLESAQNGLEQWHAHAVMLPCDAEGVPFRVGDHVEVPDGPPDEGRADVRGIIGSMRLRRTGWFVRVFADGKGRGYLPENVRHAQADTFAAIIEDAAEYGAGRTFAGASGDRERIAELVERCERVARREG